MAIKILTEIEKKVNELRTSAKSQKIEIRTSQAEEYNNWKMNITLGEINNKLEGTEE